MTTRNAEPTTIGDVTCLNCGRALAEVIRHGTSGELRLCPALNQSAVQVLVAGRRLLRCAHCGGRAFIELSTVVHEVS
jgi:hypothetical protein